MSSIDERVVQMKFNNSQFESGIKQTTDSLDKLKAGLNLKGAADSLNDLDAAGKRFSLAGIASGVDTLVSRFSALGIIGITALANITNSALNAGKALVSSLTIDPIKSGLQEYETNLNAIQTILANTQSKGSTLDDVNAALQELNTYSDKTIYNFSEMARNIGTFTAAGVDLNTSVSAIKGIANLAALSGSNSDQASTAMYQLSQALATGTVKLMDWNSVVNAGMGGQVFQDAIKDTARVHGVAVDKIIKDEGSFRDSLQKGWLTADILNETLARFTGDLSAQQLKAMGYSDEQIAASVQLGKTASDAATKVKTASQLIGTLQEAVGSGWTNTWQLIFGDFEEAKTMWTGVNNVLGGMISQSANARNGMLKDWKDLGGRTALIDTVKNAWSDLLTVLEPIHDAFVHIFPPLTGKQLFDFTVKIRDFFASIKLGGADTNNLRRTFQGVFAVFDIVWQVIKKVAGVLGDLLGFANKGSGSFLEFTAKIGDWLTKLDEAIKKGDKLNGFFKGLENVLKVPIAALQFLGGFIKNFFENITNTNPLKAFGDAISTAFETIKTRFKPLADLGNWLSGIWTGIVAVFKWVLKVFQPVVDAFQNFFTGLGNAIADSIKTSDFSNVFAVLNTGLFAGLVLAIRKFLKGGLDIDFGGGLLDSVKGVFDTLTDSLKTMQTQVKSKIIINIAIAVGILSASLVALSLLDPVKLAAGLGAMSVVLGELFGGLLILTKIMGKDAFSSGKILAITGAMDLMAGSLVAIAGAVAILGHLKLDELIRGVGGLAGVLAIMVGSVMLLSLIPAPALLAASGAIAIISGSLVTVAFGLGLLAAAMKIMGTLSWEDIGKGLTIMSAGLLILAVALTAMALTLPGAAGLVVAAGGLAVLAGALKLMGTLSWEDIGKGMTILSAGLLIMAVGLTAMIVAMPGAAALVVAAAGLAILAPVLKSMGQLSWEDIGKGMTILGGSLLIMAVGLTGMIAAMPGAAALVVAAGALIVLNKALKQSAKLSWDDIGRSMAVLGSSLAILAVGLTLMIAGLPGAAALTVAAGALVVLGGALKIFSSMSWDDIGRAMATLGASLAIIAVGGTLLIPAIPGLIGLGVAAALIGVGALAAGVGLAAFSVGLGTLAVVGAVGAAALVGLVQSLIGLIPQVLVAIGTGIIQMAGVIATGGPQFIAAGTTLMLSLLTAIQTVTPQINATLSGMLLDFLNTVAANIGPYTDAGMRILLGFLQGIDDHISDVIAVGADIIVKFIQGVSDHSQDIIDAAGDAIVDFVNGLADSIDAHTDDMRDAGGRLAWAIVNGMTGGLADGIGDVVAGAVKLAGSAWDAAMGALDAHSPSRKFIKLGGWTAQGLVIGMDNGTGIVQKSAANMGTTAIESLKSAMSAIATTVSTDVDTTPVIRPVLDMTSFKKDAGQISSYLQTPTLSVGQSYNQAASVAIQDRENKAYLSSEDDGFGTDSSGNVIFNQYNTSPKALSEPEIYRQTRNQISLAKESLSI